MIHTVLGELGTQPLHSAFSQDHEVRPRCAGSQPPVTDQVMKYKLAGREGGRGKEQKLCQGCSIHPSYVLIKLLSHTLGHSLPILFL